MNIGRHRGAKAPPDAAGPGMARRSAAARRPGGVRRAERGILLLECMVYLSLWALIVGFAFAAFYQCMDYSKRLGRTTEDIARTVRAGERWRADVRAAAGPIRSLDEGADARVIRIPRGTGEVDYRFAGGVVSRRVGAAAPWVPVLTGVQSSEMRADTGQRVLSWRWEIELKPRQKPPQIRPLFSFEAVPATGS